MLAATGRMCSTTLHHISRTVGVAKQRHSSAAMVRTATVEGNNNHADLLSIESRF